jgi:REP-associated tyrosine transposase
MLLYSATSTAVGSAFVIMLELKKISFISPHPSYLQLGSSKKKRFRAYQVFFSGHEVMRQISDAWLTGTPLSNDIFREKIEK